MAIEVADIDQVLRAAGIPCISVSLGNLTDRSTWRIDYDVSATATQRQQGAALLLAYVEPTPADALHKEATFRLADKAVLAALLALYEAIPAPTLTKAQVKTRAIAIYKTL